jgi:selenide,water dikinase
MVEVTTQLNIPGTALAEMEEVHALTDVTGFGLAGHLLEICRGSKLGAEVRFDDMPVLPEALEWVKEGTATGASDRNWKGYGHEVHMPAGAPDWKRKLLSDPQTSGGLLVACAPSIEKRVLEEFRRSGFSQAGRIGAMRPGAASLTVV